MGALTMRVIFLSAVLLILNSCSKPEKVKQKEEKEKFTFESITGESFKRELSKKEIEFLSMIFSNLENEKFIKQFKIDYEMKLEPCHNLEVNGKQIKFFMRHGFFYYNEKGYKIRRDFIKKEWEEFTSLCKEEFVKHTNVLWAQLDKDLDELINQKQYEKALKKCRDFALECHLEFKPSIEKSINLIKEYHKYIQDKDLLNWIVKFELISKEEFDKLLKE